jgi:hypothetical protein
VPLLLYPAKRGDFRNLSRFLHFFIFLYTGRPPAPTAGEKRTKAIETLFEWLAIAMFEEGYPTIEFNYLLKI